MGAVKEIYDAKRQIIDCRRLIRDASIKRDVATVVKLLERIGRIRREIEIKYAVIIDY